jgi:hypothetical protein
MAISPYTAVSWVENDVFTPTQASNLSAQTAAITAGLLAIQYRAGTATRSAVTGNNTSGAALTITFSSAMPDTKYALTGVIRDSDSAEAAWCRYLHWAVISKSTTGCVVHFWNTNASNSPAVFFDYVVVGY